MSNAKRFAVIGASGFVGRAVVEAALSDGHEVAPVRVKIDTEKAVSAPGIAWPRRFSQEYDTLTRAIAAAQPDAVINAAGVADPHSVATSQLTAANVVLPALAADAVQELTVPRLVHVSSAAVQGRQDPLDEEPTWEPFSPYTESKTRAEQILLASREKGESRIVIYRATSVHGPDRAVTKRFAQTARHRALPVCHQGAVPVPVALWCNLGTGIVHAASAPRIEGIVLQPDEGMTAADLWRAFRPDVRLVNVPVSVARSGLACIRTLGRLEPRVEPMGRRLEMLLLGQRVQATRLEESGYRPIAGSATWRELGRTMRTAATCVS